MRNAASRRRYLSIPKISMLLWSDKFLRLMKTKLGDTSKKVNLLPLPTTGGITGRWFLSK